MSQEPVPKPQAAAQESDPGALSAFVLALREALLGMPPSALPAESAELRAEVARLQALAKRLEAHEADLELAKRKLIGPWQQLLDEALPKLKARLDAPGLQNVFEFQGLLEEIRRRLAGPPHSTLPEGLQAQEVARLQAEVVRLLEVRRRAETEAPPLKARIADLEAQLLAAQEQLQRQARETAEARTQRDESARELELARKQAAELEWQKAYRDAAAQSIESRQFQEQFQQLRERITGLEGELDRSRHAALVAAQEIARLSDELSRAVRQAGDLEGERRRLSESDGLTRAAAGRLKAAAEAAQGELEGVKQRELALKVEIADMTERLAAARAESDHERAAKLELAESVRRLEEQVAAGTRLRAELEPRLRQAMHDAAESGVALERAKARLSILEESNAERAVQLELSTRRLGEEADTAKRLAEALETVQRAQRALEASAQREAQNGAIRLERVAAERDRAAAALEEALAKLGQLEQEAGYARAAEKSSLDRAVEAETRFRQADAARRRLEGETARAREELAEGKTDSERGAREAHALLEGLAASEAAQREAVRLSKTLAGEVESLGERVAAAERRLSDANAALDEASQTSGKASSGRRAIELETQGLRVDLARAEAALAQERKERAALEDEVAQARSRLMAEASLAKERAESDEPADVSAPPAEPEPAAAPGAGGPGESFREPAPPPQGLDGLDSALRTLLGALEAALTVVRAATDASGASRPVIQNVHAELTVVQDQIRALVEFFRAPPLPAPRNIAPIVEAVLKGWTPALKARGIALERRIRGELPPCLIGPERLTLVVHQLLRNAREVMPDGGRLDVELDLEHEDVRLVLRDTGPGLPDDVLQDPARPFRRSTPGHMGLGLALAYRVARTAGGELRLANPPEGGAELQLLLPRHVPRQR